MGKVTADTAAFDAYYKKDGVTPLDLSDLTNNNGIGSNIQTWSTATRPASPAVGMMGYNTNNDAIDIWNGAAWTQTVPNDTSAPPAATEGATVFAGATAIDAQGSMLYWDGTKYAYTKGQTLQSILVSNNTLGLGNDVVNPGANNGAVKVNFAPRSINSTIRIQTYTVFDYPTIAAGDRFRIGSDIVVGGVTEDSGFWSINTTNGTTFTAMHGNISGFAQIPSWSGSKLVKLFLTNNGTQACTVNRRFLLIDEITL